jgi:hypothetical protein
MFNNASGVGIGGGMPMGMGGSSPMTPQAPSMRREMKPPSGVDDILETFKEVRRAELDSNPVFIPAPPPATSSSNPSAMNSQPAISALSEMHSVHSQDIMSQGGGSSMGGGRRGRKPQIPAGMSTVSLNL